MGSLLDLAPIHPDGLMQYGFSLNPHEILGIKEDASLQELRDAYREKAKRYHPDHGGDAWVFRLVSRAYEILGTARVAGRMATETASPAPAPKVAPMHPPTAGSATVPTETTRAGLHDDVKDPARLVDVEMFLLRYAITDPMQLLMGSSSDRTLSCNLNVGWPSKSYPEGEDRDRDEADPMLTLVAKAFAPLAKKTRAIGSQAHVENGRFVGWLSYADVKSVKDALQELIKSFHAQGLGIDQRTREMLLPREDS